jgi:hypothetical protein
MRLFLFLAVTGWASCVQASMEGSFYLVALGSIVSVLSWMAQHSNRWMRAMLVVVAMLCTLAVPALADEVLIYKAPLTEEQLDAMQLDGCMRWCRQHPRECDVDCRTLLYKHVRDYRRLCFDTETPMWRALGLCNY